jgi:hypothetical protein
LEEKGRFFSIFGKNKVPGTSFYGTLRRFLSGVIFRHLVDTGLSSAGGPDAKVMKACYGGKQCKT